tara:strand:- start:161 stop:313 length:153 start_codon:yes stop_codon:yes gene_type:complete
MAANNILKIKTIRRPDYVERLDPERYKNKPNILKIQKRVKLKKKKKKRTA